MDVKNKGTAVAKDVGVGLDRVLASLQVTRWSIHSDHNQPAGSFKLNDTDSLQKIPHDNPGASFSLSLGAFSMGETKRIKLTVKASAGSLGQAGHPAVRAWVSGVKDCYAKASYGAKPSLNTKGHQSHNGGDLRHQAQLDVLAPEACGDSVDNDCDGKVDEGCAPATADAGAPDLAGTAPRQDLGAGPTPDQGAPPAMGDGGLAAAPDLGPDRATLSGGGCAAAGDGQTASGWVLLLPVLAVGRRLRPW